MTSFGKFHLTGFFVYSKMTALLPLIVWIELGSHAILGRQFAPFKFWNELIDRHVKLGAILGSTRKLSAASWLHR